MMPYKRQLDLTFSDRLSSSCCPIYRKDESQPPVLCILLLWLWRTSGILVCFSFFLLSHGSAHRTDLVNKQEIDFQSPVLFKSNLPSGLSLASGCLVGTTVTQHIRSSPGHFCSRRCFCPSHCLSCFSERGEPSNSQVVHMGAVYRINSYSYL